MIMSMLQMQCEDKSDGQCVAFPEDTTSIVADSSGKGTISTNLDAQTSVTKNISVAVSTPSQKHVPDHPPLTLEENLENINSTVETMVISEGNANDEVRIFASTTAISYNPLSDSNMVEIQTVGNKAAGRKDNRFGWTVYRDEREKIQ